MCVCVREREREESNQTVPVRVGLFARTRMLCLIMKSVKVVWCEIHFIHHLFHVLDRIFRIPNDGMGLEALPETKGKVTFRLA